MISGDYRQGMVLDVNRTPFDTDSTLVATEFMAPPISSVLFSQPVDARTPQLHEQLDGHGYLLVTVTPDDVTADFASSTTCDPERHRDRVHLAGRRRRPPPPQV